MQPKNRASHANQCQFQSSPDPEAGCNVDRVYQRGMNEQRFNPHPTRRPGATGAAARSTSSFLIKLFQSSPDPEAGCNTVSSAVSASARGFQSSPDPEAGCNRIDFA